MNELKKVGEKTYYIDNPSKVGIYKINDTDVCLIDSGNDKEFAKKILKILDENHWALKAIINTHSNADHIGGNAYLQEKTNCPIYTKGIEKCFTEYPILESSFLYGGYPYSELRNKFLLAKESTTLEYTNQIDGLETFALKGHFFDMIGIKTADNVYFIADSVSSEEILNKYHIGFIYDIESYLKTLDDISSLDGYICIPSHAPETIEISKLASINREKMFQIMDQILLILKDAKSFEQILKELFDYYNLVMSSNQYVLVGSTLRSYLSYLYNINAITFCFQENMFLWKVTE